MALNELSYFLIQPVSYKLGIQDYPFHRLSLVDYGTLSPLE